MEDVATLAEVSKATVSRCLNSPHQVMPATLKRVVSAIDRLGYEAKNSTNALLPKSLPIVALMIPTVRSSLFSNTALGAEKTGEAGNHHVLIGSSHYSPEKERMLLELWLKLPLSGLILAGFFESNRDLVYKFPKMGIPSVVTYEILSSDEINYVGLDNFEAAYKATEYLLSLGHRKIATIIGPFSGIRRAKRRFKGYISALEEKGIKYRQEYVIETEPTLLDGKEGAARLLSLDDPPTAIFCASDPLAMGAITEVKACGLKVPNDVSVMGFDDIEFAAFCDPALTTVRLPSYEMGTLSMKIIMNANRANREFRQYKLQTDLVIRDSCAPPRQATAAETSQSPKGDFQSARNK